ncbi:hypothetical protein Taro_007986 [Colocasia esculenta]|uniref:Uncharacterized protein n=1 Tax=Colocasia esculenta TaxID=4460 RepID=A0A843U0J6_COLES|nr:hypothetical protein [Colocasia esculenta]
MAPNHYFLLSLLPRLLPPVLLLLPAAAGNSSPAAPPYGNLSAYAVLESYDFPAGLLPKSVVGYELDASTGRFSAYLNGTCSFSIEGSYQLRYKSTVSGYISDGRLLELNGVSVKVLFFWVNIIEVTRKGDDLTFSVGIASADFSVDNFLESPQCGCGFECLTTPLPSGDDDPRLNQRRLTLLLAVLSQHGVSSVREAALLQSFCGVLPTRTL